MVRRLTFGQALAETTEIKRHLLLGNGFSIALFPQRFRYDSLLEQANFVDVPHLRQAFDALRTVDFEEVIKALLDMARLAPLYGAADENVARILADAERVKDLLAAAIAGRHPARPNEVSEDQYASCRRFLSHFVGEDRGNRRGQVYTLNYDLLLYWTLLHTEPGANNVSLVSDDGFRAPVDDPDAPVVVWDGEEQHSQCIHFVHGGLHLFDRGSVLEKVCWQRGGGHPLLDQIRQALDEGRFPLFVAEASSDDKLDRIRHSAYLHRGLRSFAGINGHKTQSLFIFGHSLAPNDDHILRWIPDGKVARVYVSVFGDPDAEPAAGIVRELERWERVRDPRSPLNIAIFNAQDSNPWTAH